MGIFNTFGAVSGQMSARQERLQVADAFVEELKVPGRLAELLDSLRTSGQGDLMRQWIAGSTEPVSATQLQQGLRNCALLQNLATRTKMPTGVVKTGLSVLLPLTIAQLAREGYVTADGESSEKSLTELNGLAEALR